MADAQPVRTVTGHVLRTDNTPFGDRGFSVRAFDAVSASNLVPLGNAVALQANGAYRIPYAWQSTGGRNGPNLVVQVLSPEGMVVGQAGRPFAAVQETLNITVNILAPVFEYRVRGTVRQSNGVPVAGATVQIVDWDRGGEDPLVTTRTNGDGDYEGRFTAAQFRSSEGEVGGPDLIVRVYNGQGQLVARSPRRNNAQPEETINLTVTVLETDLEAHALIVQGTITLADGTVLPEVLVRAFDRDMSSEEPLGEQAINAQGVYRISYTPAQFRRAEKSNADLVVRDYRHTDATASVNLVELAASEILFKAPPVATVDVTVPAAAYRGPSEWERHHATILPVRVASDGVTHVAMAILTDDHLNFLSREAEIPIEHLRQDDQWA